jgi:hypothetical protein
LRAGSTDWADLSRTEAAIERHDALEAELDSDAGADLAIENPGRASNQLERLDFLAREVGRAFGLDTADRNDPTTCEALVRPGPAVPRPGYELSFVRRMVKQWKEQEKES